MTRHRGPGIGNKQKTTKTQTSKKKKWGDWTSAIPNVARRRWETKLKSLRERSERKSRMTNESGKTGRRQNRGKGGQDLRKRGGTGASVEKLGGFSHEDAETGTAYERKKHKQHKKAQKQKQEMKGANSRAHGWRFLGVMGRWVCGSLSYGCGIGGWESKENERLLREGNSRLGEVRGFRES